MNNYLFNNLTLLVRAESGWTGRRESPFEKVRS